MDLPLDGETAASSCVALENKRTCSLSSDLYFPILHNVFKIIYLSSNLCLRIVWNCMCKTRELPTSLKAAWIAYSHPRSGEGPRTGFVIGTIAAGKLNICPACNRSLEERKFDRQRRIPAEIVQYIPACLSARPDYLIICNTNHTCQLDLKGKLHSRISSCLCCVLLKEMCCVEVSGFSWTWIRANQL